MKNMGDYYFSIPFAIRVALWMFLFIMIFWRVFKGIICYILSLIPYTLQWIFKKSYLLIEIPIATFHKKYGSFFAKMDYHLAEVGQKTDRMLDRWYSSWHTYKILSFKKSLPIYGLCVALVLIPHYMDTDIHILKIGDALYLWYEDLLENFFEKTESDREVEEFNSIQGDSVGDGEEDITAVTFVVSGVKTSLLVRDAPSTQDSTILGRLHNGDMVVWNGYMAFSQIDNGRVEAWIKIVTVDGIEGWSRLYYLRPEQYEDIEFHLDGP